jgi:hypothetical protein
LLDVRLAPNTGTKADIGFGPFRADFVAEIGIQLGRDG